MRVEYQAWEGEERVRARGALQALRSSMADAIASFAHFQNSPSKFPMPRIWGTQLEQSILLAEIYPTFKDQARSPCGEAILSAPTPCTIRPS